MEKYILLFVLLNLILSSFNKPKSEIWEFLKEKTWFSSNSWAGEQIVFYETSNGLEKAIWQFHGSGVNVTTSIIYDVEIQNDTIYLNNGLDLIDGNKFSIINGLKLIYIRNDSTLVSKGNELKF